MSPLTETYPKHSRTASISVRPMPTGPMPTSKRVRADALPEYIRYQDNGCEVHPSCLTCPLNRCRYDEPGGLRALINADRDRKILELRLGGATVDDLAGRFGVSRRTVFRILSTRIEASQEDRPPGRRRNGHPTSAENDQIAAGGLPAARQAAR